MRSVHYLPVCETPRSSVSQQQTSKQGCTRRHRCEVWSYTRTIHVKNGNESQKMPLVTHIKMANQSWEGSVPRIDLDSLSSWMQTCWGCTPFSSLSGSGMLARALARGDRPFTLGAGASRVGAVISFVNRRCSDTLSHLHIHSTCFSTALSTLPRLHIFQHTCVTMTRHM